MCFLHDVVPLLISYVDEEYIAHFMVLYSFLELGGEHVDSEKPFRVAMGGIAIHGVLIG